MREPLFTDGPWTIYHGDARYDGFEGYAEISAWHGDNRDWIAHTVVRVEDDDSERGRANASLIAAAPELYHALDALVEDAEKQMANPSHHMPFSLPRAKEILAKAREPMNYEYAPKPKRS